MFYQHYEESVVFVVANIANALDVAVKTDV
jgi:hypothetical protein